MSEHEKLRGELERLAAGFVAGRGLRDRTERRIRQRRQRRRAAVVGATALAVAGAVAVSSLIGSDPDDSVLHPTPTTESRSDPSSDDPCEGEPVLIADLDGDGRDDEVFGRWLSQEGEPAAPGAGDYALGACTAAGERAALRGVGSEVITAVDVEGDGRAELLVGGTSASATFLDVVVFVDGDLERVASKGGRIQLLEGNLAWDEGAAAPAEAAAVGCEDLDGDGRAELVQVTTSFTSVEASWTKQGFTLDGAGAEPSPPVTGVEPFIDDDRLGFTAALTPACQDASSEAATD